MHHLNESHITPDSVDTVSGRASFPGDYLRCEDRLTLIPAPAVSYPASEVARAIRRLRAVRGTLRRPEPVSEPAATSDPQRHRDTEAIRWRWREDDRHIDIGFVTAPASCDPSAASAPPSGEHEQEGVWVACPMLARCEYLDLLRLWSSFMVRFPATLLRDVEGRVYTLPAFIQEVALARLRPALNDTDATNRERAQAVEVQYLDLLRTYSTRVASKDAPSIPAPVLYEDADLLIVDKPAGLVMHPTYKHPDGTLTDAVFAREAAQGRPRPWLLHRLDKETSGVTLFARTDRARRDLSAQFAERQIHKRYLALVRWPGDLALAGELDAPLARDPLDRRRVIVTPDGEPSRTRYRALGIGAPVVTNGSEGPSFALVLAEPVTGRTHQIRAHLAWAGAPLAGDETYLGALPESDPARSLAPRVMLHAWSLTLRHPRHGEQWSITSPPPADFRTAAEALGLGEALQDLIESSPSTAPEQPLG